MDKMASFAPQPKVKRQVRPNCDDWRLSLDYPRPSSYWEPICSS